MDDSSPVLDDGAYDALVVDASVDGPDSTVCVVEVTILAGPHKGEVVALRARGLVDDADAALDLLGTPATLVVTDGVPTLTLEP